MGHYVLLAGKVSDTVYQVVDPWNASVWNITVNGTSAIYAKGTATIHDTIDGVYQYYSPNPHTHSWNSTGHCTDSSCNAQFDFDATLDAAKAGYYTVTKSDGTYPRTGGPYDAATKSAYKLKKGQEVKVVGLGHMHGYGRCYTWAGGCGSSAVYSSSYHALKAPVPYSSARDFHGTGVYYTDNTGEGRGFAYINSGSPYYVAPVTQYRYRSRSQIWTYYFYRWTSWSNWSETKVSSSSTRNVETRTIYRFRDEVPIYDTSAGTEDTTGTAYHITGEIKAKQNLSGKVATVMVYQSKNMDPNQYQMQYVGQTTLLDGNKYDINFIPIKEPTIESGNYVVALGIQGTTGLLSVDVVEAPKAEYTVRFLMDDGGVISAQTVREGENATVPTIPTKTGYRFIGWSERSTGIFKNVDIIAQFEKEQYLVTFVDWVNESIGFQKYYYGDTISAPYTPTAEGHTFKGWDAILNGNTTVTDNMVVSAVYDKQTFTVQFLDADGKVYQTQQVAYGESATLPDALTVEGKVFLGWSTDVMWWNVTADIDVAPILAYGETTVAPISNTETGNSISLNRDVVHFAVTDISHTHTYTDAITAPTCTEQGYTLHMCFCGDSYTDTYVDALGHAWDDGIITVQPTDENAGEKTLTCTRCGSTRTEVIPATGDYIPCDGVNCPGKAFTDMPEKGNWAHDPIDWAVSNEITNGTSASTFSPEEGCTRAQVVTFLWRAAGQPDPASSTNPFTDVKPGAYYYNAVLWAVEKGITNGTSDTTFGPDETCTRAQIVTFLWRYEGQPTPTSTNNPFADVKPSAYFGSAVLWAVESDITNGTSATTFDPEDTCTRAQVVTFLYRNVLK